MDDEPQPHRLDYQEPKPLEADRSKWVPGWIVWTVALVGALFVLTLLS